MKNAILLHGTPDKEEYYSDKYPSCSNSHWFPWLQKQLLIKNIYAQTPEIQDAHKPDYKKWKAEFARYDVDEETLLVGHSCGGGFLTRWLSENEVEVDKLVLVAPWLDPDRRKTTDFFDFKINPNISKRVNEIHLFVSKDDAKDILKSVDMITKSIPNIKVHEYEDKGHFCFEDLKTEEFPELLKVVTDKHQYGR